MAMKLSSLTVFLSCFQLLIAAPPPPAKPGPDPDSYKLVLVWPNTFCVLQPIQTPCQRKPQTFTLHGYWPQAGGRSIEYCDPSIIDYTTIYRQKDNLNNYWPDLKHANFEESKSFWQYEWRRHGSCSKMAPATYLKTVFEKMKMLYDVKGILAENGIIPAAYPKGYSPKKFVDAIFNDPNLHVYPEIKCEWNENGTRIYLYEITLCVNAKDSEFMNCSNTHTIKNYCATGSGQSDVILPPATESTAQYHLN